MWNMDDQIPMRSKPLWGGAVLEPDLKTLIYLTVQLLLCNGILADKANVSLPLWLNRPETANTINKCGFVTQP